MSANPIDPARRQSATIPTAVSSLSSGRPFANLPEEKSGRWALGLTAEKIKDCRWVRPQLVGEFEYVEWTPGNHLRHSRFVALRQDVIPADVHREK